MLYKATNHMNVKDAVITRGGRTKKRKRQDNPRLDGQVIVEDNSDPN